MNFWHEQSLARWAQRQKRGDRWLPFQQYLRIFASAEFNYPRSMNGGQGIVIAGGGRFLPGVWVTVNLLRYFGCPLPVELWYLGEAECGPFWKGLFESVDVKCVDALQVRQQHPCHSLSGWQLKPYSIIFSDFEEVLFLDADNHPARNPAHLFEHPEYFKTGAVFWPDRERHGRNATLWEIFGVPFREEASHETGQMLIDKRRCWHALQMAMHCNEFAKFHYQHSHGDTALLRFSFHALCQPFTMMPYRLIEVPVAREVEDIDTLKHTAYLRKEGDINAVFYQRDFDGDILFQHRTAGGGAQAKFTLGQNIHVQHWQHEELCFRLLNQLREKMETGADFWTMFTQTDPEKISQHRAEAFKALFGLMEERKAKLIVETGTLRQENNWHNDGGFSYLAAKYATLHEGRLYTVDIDDKAIQVCRKLTKRYEDVIEYTCADSVKFLQDCDALSQQIDVLYLDSLDYDKDAEGAQRHNLAEVQAALPHLHRGSIIAIDDCALAGGGKGGLSIPFLCEHGWKVYHQGYVVILTRQDS